MATKYTWVKVYTEFLDDPKIRRLPIYLQLRVIELFLLAGRNGNGGALQPVEEMAWVLRSSADDVRKSLTSLAEIGVVQETQPGEWTVVNFVKRQAAMTEAERQQRFRAGKALPKQKNKSQPCHNFVTEVEEEKEEEKESTTSTTTRANVFSFFGENFGALTPFLSDKLSDLEKTYSEQWTLAAMAEAVASGARNLKYVEAILARWKTAGFQAPRQKPQPENGRGGSKKNAAQAIDELSAWAAEKERNVYTN